MVSPQALFYAATAAASAFLLFLVEPMFAKMILPRLGGAANVWITAMLFYQAMLLVGYGYAHLLGRFSPRRQWQIHMALLILSILALPLAIPVDWSPPTQGNPSLALLGMMTLALGAPFAILAATAPLVQRWLFISRPLEDPYLLYAFSNAGSFAALFAYPLIVEPHLSLAAQSRLWTFGFLLFAAALLVAGRFLWNATQDPLQSMRSPTWRMALRWLGLAALPSSLMLSTTSFLTTDVAGVPLFWIIPLALYLISFVLAFSSASQRCGDFAARFYPLLLIPTSIGLAAILGKANSFNPLLLLLPLAAFFLAALLCHCELARLKPEASQLTAFFLVLACGGALGGAFNSLLAPVIFPDIYEFPLGLALACLALPPAGAGYSLLSMMAGGAAGAVTASAGWFSQAEFRMALLVIGALVLWPIRGFPLALAFGVSVFFGGAIIGLSSNGVVFAERNFYGVNRVRDHVQAGLRVLEHGTTAHGLLALAPERRFTLLGYYNPAGALGEATRLHAPGTDMRIAVVGLGAGEMLCNGPAEARYDFYEIDPAVVRIASDSRLFPFLAECPARHTVILGDGRLQLQKAPDGAYDVMIIDAFSSDSIPYHLMTREAIEDYMRKLAPDGVLLLHISSRYFNLSPVLAAEARDLGLAGAIQLSAGRDVEDTALPIYGTLVVALSRTRAPLEKLHAAGWKRLTPIPGVSAWTDDWSDPLSVLMLPWRPIGLAWDETERP